MRSFGVFFCLCLHSWHFLGAGAGGAGPAWLCVCVYVSVPFVRGCIGAGEA